MLEKYLNKDNLKDEHLEDAYIYLKQYCEENQLDILKFVKDKKNIDPASDYIHKQLPLAIRLILKPKKIAALIEENHNFIIEKAKEFKTKEKKSKKIK